MFGSTNPFGQTSSPFGSQTVFGQTSNASTNPFAPKPFGSPQTPFGAQTGSSIFGSTSTGVFGQPSTPTFGTSSPSPSPFGSTTPAFGASSTPAFGASSTPTFGSGSLFGQKPAFGGFGSSPTSQSSPFGSTFQQTQPAFGSNVFGATSTPAFGATSTPAFGATSTPAFGATSAPAFGATSTPVFGATSTPAFGSTSTPAFGSTSTSLFGASSTPAFGSTASPAFGSSSSSLFGSTTPSFGAASTPAFGASTAPAFGASSSPFGFNTTPAFGQSTSAFGTTGFGTTPSPYNAQSSTFGTQATTPTFGSSGFGQTFGSQAGGTRIAPYTQTSDADSGTGTQPAAKLDSISAMPVYKDKSHEELRWEDYQRGDKGGPNTSGQPAGATSFPTQQQQNPFGGTGAFGQTGSSLFSSSASNPFAAKSSAFGSTGFASTSTPLFSSPFSSAAPSPSPFAPTSATASAFGQTSGGAFGSNTSPSIFGATTPAFGSSSIFGSSMAGSSASFGTGLSLGTQPSALFNSTATFGNTPSPFAPPSSGFQQSSASFSSSLFSTPSTGGLFSSTTSALFPTPSFSTQFQATTPNQSQSTFSFNLPQMQTAPSGGPYGVGNTLNQPGAVGQIMPGQSNMVMQPAPVTNPFGTLPAMPQMSIGHVGSSPSVQYGISSLPVAEKPLPVRTLSMLVPRHLSQRRIKLPPRKYNPKSDGSKVPFFADEDETPSTPKADAFFIPRENPRTLIIRPIEQWPPRNTSDKQTNAKEAAVREMHNGKAPEDPSASKLRFEDRYDAPAEREGDRVPLSPTVVAPKENGIHYEDHMRKESHAPVVHENGTDIERLMPKLRHADYYTEPRLEELAAKERAEPGFCCRVKDFIVGRHEYGSIKFIGETDVRALDLESVVEFNKREVIVYKDENKKPPVGHGLNKPAEVTLLNIKCMNKRTGEQYTEGPRVDKYKEMLMKKAEEQGAEFVSYDAAKGEWKFKVKHFSSYEFGDGPYFLES